MVMPYGILSSEGRLNGSVAMPVGNLESGFGIGFDDHRVQEFEKTVAVDHFPVYVGFGSVAFFTIFTVDFDRASRDCIALVLQNCCI